MSSSFDVNWPRIRDLIAIREGTIGNPPAVPAIEQAEIELGVRFPPSYRHLVTEVGALVWPADVLGLGAGIPPGYNVVKVNLWERNEAYLKLPNHLLAFGPDGWGNHYCIQTSTVEGEEGPVVLWNHNLDELQIPQITHPSFTDWLQSTLAEAIQEEV